MLCSADAPNSSFDPEAWARPLRQELGNMKRRRGLQKLTNAGPSQQRRRSMTVRHFTSKDAKFFQYRDKEIFVGDVLDPSNSENMSVGYYRNKNKGEKNEWVVTYDEALIVVKGALTIRYAEGVKTARAGEIIFLTKGTAIAYEAGENDTEVVYVSYPHWLDAQQKSEHAHLLDSYHPVA
jgi:ethanolamine utilization protein EutQ